MRLVSREIKLDYRDVLIVPQRSDIPSRTEVDLVRSFTFKHSTRKLKGIPIIAANMDAIGTFEMAEALSKEKMFVALHKYLPITEIYGYFLQNKKRRWNHVFYTVGMGDFKQMLAFRNDLQDPDFPYLINFDVANGMTETFVKELKKLRKIAPNSIIMAGNVVGANMAEHLILCGADIVKVGIGPGSVCTTRVKAGIGYPQLSAIDEAAYTAHGLKGHVCGDGGCSRVGDIAKGFAAGADFIMIGGMIAGTDECSGKWIYHAADTTKKHSLKFYGMASEDAQNKYNGGLKDYKASEGKCVEVPYKGKVENVLREIKGGLTSACTYVGASRIKDLPKCASFVRCTQQENIVFGKER